MKHYIFIYSMSLLITSTLVACGSTSSGKRTGKPLELEFADNTQKTDTAAHWVKPSLILLAEKKPNPALIFSKSAGIDDKKEADSIFNLVTTDMPAWVSTELPHLAKFYAYSVDIPKSEINSKLKQQAAVISRDNKAKITSLSYVQSAKLLDALYTSTENDANEIDNYGALIVGDNSRFTVWAPTALNVKVRLFDKNKNPLESGIITLDEDPQTGVWSGITSLASQGTFYRYQIEVYHPQSKAIETLQVTDPYSLSLSTNSEYSQVVDLASDKTQPVNWALHQVPTVESPESLILYETHIRDFSASDTTLSDPQLAGKYAAFSQAHSDSINHLKALKNAGLNTVHLLPTYDLSTVDELPGNVISMHDNLQKVCSFASEVAVCQTDYNPELTLQALLQSYDVSSSDAQAVLEIIRTKDAYNWGYDPFHYTVPEGSYALNPEGIPRLIEFRQMVMRLHQLGFRVIMDVVYNHTFAAGLAEKSVLDKVVPNYYHRLNPVTGAIEQSTCCENSATEHAMMAKLMTDSLVTWTKHYKIDGFRFDLMGHQPKKAMLLAREAVRKVDPDTYFYGEGWNFGEVANNQQFVQASQNELAGTEIGTFTDRLRDAIRGGSSFLSGDDIRKGQGLGNGLEVFPNELHYQLDPNSVHDEYLLSMDQARIGLAGNLAIFPIENAQGQRVFGRDIDYGGSPTGYALDPADTINYVSKHDNQTLWDNNQYRIPFQATTEQRVRLQLMSLAYPLMAQGIPFLHMGSELLRSKSYLRDSYDYGDWFNKVDFSKQTNNYHVGLPPAEKDRANWSLISNIIEQNESRDIVSANDIQFSSDVFMDFLKIRSTTALFSLQTADQILRRVKFLNTGPNQKPGLIVMAIDDPYSRDLDPNFEEIMVIFNHNPQAQTYAMLGAEQYSLHPVQQQGADPVVKTASANVDGFVIPALTVAVFVR